ncbi:MAG TPA: PLD nuclease N-terminal domain-containing protein [Thermomicrobiales bacterium]|nr:PLD nuclease N-terminal domain-containing protein [Thermomicrobiales bacterium]
MTVQTALAIALVVGFGAAQYILMIQALRDLVRRPRVRGGNKVAWGLLILCVPIVGALIYGWMGPTSLLRRPAATAERPPTRRPLHYAGRTAARRNITPITDARRSRTTAPPPEHQGDRPAPRRFPRTGS